MWQHGFGHHERPDIPNQFSPLPPGAFTQGAAPTVVADAPAGAGASAALGNEANDNSGVVSLTVGTGPSSGGQVTVNFNTPFRGKAVVLFPNNANAASVATDIFAGLFFPIGSDVASGFIIDSTAALTPGDTYAWNYIVL